MFLLHRHLPAADVIAGITVALEARKAGRLRREGDIDADVGPDPLFGTVRVISLTERRLTGAQLPVDRRPLPSVAAYDQLLPLRAAQNRQPLQASPHALPSQGEVS
ncbi:MAG: hypothetical protein ACRDQ4_23175 [Pseudonocardiaceae bacterium]